MFHQSRNNMTQNVGEDARKKWEGQISPLLIAPVIDESQKISFKNNKNLSKLKSVMSLCNDKKQHLKQKNTNFPK